MTRMQKHKGMPQEGEDDFFLFSSTFLNAIEEYVDEMSSFLLA